MRKRTY